MNNDTLSLYKEIKTYTEQLSAATAILIEVWLQVRIPFKNGFSAGGISTYKSVKEYLQSRGILDEDGRFKNEEEIQWGKNE